MSKEYWVVHTRSWFVTDSEHQERRVMPSPGRVQVHAVTKADMHSASTELRWMHTQAFLFFFSLTHSSVNIFFARKHTFSHSSCIYHTYLIHMYLCIHDLSIITNHPNYHTLRRHASLLPPLVQSKFPRPCIGRSVKYLRIRVR